MFPRHESVVEGEFEVLDVTDIMTATGTDENSLRPVTVHVVVWLRIKKPGTRNNVYRAYGQFVYTKGKHPTFRDACPWRRGTVIPHKFVVSMPVGLTKWFRTTYVKPETSRKPFLCSQHGAILNLQDWWDSVLTA